MHPSRAYLVHHWLGVVLLQSNALQLEEHKSDLSAHCPRNVCQSIRTDNGSLCRWHAIQKQEGKLLPADLFETFIVLLCYQMKLNPSKCASGVNSRTFLSFMVNQRGIEANLEKIRAVLNMKPPRNLKQLQFLNDRITALSHFVSWATDKCLIFFQVLKKKDWFEWTIDCQDAFEQLKAYLGSTLMLVEPISGEGCSCI